MGMASAKVEKPNIEGKQASLALLKKLRIASAALAVGSGLLLPIEHGSAQALDLSSVPLLGSLFPRSIGCVSIQNYPFTAVVGQTERFSVQLLNQPHVPLVYQLYYPNGRVATANGMTDANGYSSHTFHIKGYTPTQFRETATIGVQGATNTSYHAYLHFAIQQAGPTPSVAPGLSSLLVKQMRHMNHVKLVHDLRLDRRVSQLTTPRLSATVAQPKKAGS